ncbi:MAG: hypothetical protein KGL53_12345, partial [Elusimicrobia bacterium]|nr:hypothetical protein [Elusimicrobiota bacterium]
MTTSTSVASSTGVAHSWLATDDGTTDSGFAAPGAVRSSTTLQGTGAGAAVALALQEAVVVEPTRMPQARQLAPAAYDPDTGKIYVFGGELADGTVTNSVLEYDPVSDTVQTAADALPTGLAGASAAYDPATRAVYLFGGVGTSGLESGAILKYDPLAHSVQSLLATLPTARTFTSAADDPVTQRIYVFGGRNFGTGAHLAEIVAFDPVGQSVVTVSTSLPSGRIQTAAAYEPASGDVLLFGGNATGTWLDDVVAFHPLGSSTTLLSPMPAPRAGLSAVRNPLTGRIMLYGGDDAGTPAASVYMFDPDTRQTGARGVSLPSARTLTSAAADPGTLHLYVFGGTTAASGFDEVLENVQVASGVYTSEVFDTGNLSQLGTLSWDPAAQADTSTALGVSFRAGNVSTPGPTWSNGGAFAAVSNGASLASFGSSRYVQFAATFTTVNIDTSPELADITMTFTQTAPSATLVSSAFDSGQGGNVIRRLRWQGDFQPGTTSEFQLRTAPDDGTGRPGTWSSWLGPTAATDYYRDPGGGETINPDHADGVGDRFFQYKVTLISSSTLLPAVLRTVDVTANHLPAAPTLTALLPLSTGSIEAVFTDNSDNETAFVLSTSPTISPTNVGPSTPTADGPGTGGQQSISLGGLQPNTAYFARMRAFDSPDSIYSGFSAKVGTFTLAAVPSPVSVDAVYTDSATLSWGSSGNPNNTPYEVSQSTDGFLTDFSTPVAFAEGLNALTTDFTSLAAGTTYSWRVRALNSNAIPSAFSSVVTTATPPSPLSGLAGFAAGTSSITWSWGSSGPAARYKVRAANTGA